MKKKYDITGMTCAACSLGIEKTVKKLGGVTSCEVSLMGESMSVEYDEKILKEADIFSAVLSLGYGIYKEGGKPASKKNDEEKKLKCRFISSLILLLPLMYFSMVPMILSMAGVEVTLPLTDDIWISYIAQCALTVAIIIINFKFFTNGVKALVKRVPNMDTLVTVGASAAFIYSAYLAVTSLIASEAVSDSVYFESAAMVLTLVTLGKWLEARSKKKTGREIEKLIKMMPESATVIDGEGNARLVPVGEIKEGDVVLLRAGDFIPVDGTVEDGNGSVDTSAITGESLPVEVFHLSAVRSGSILKNGMIKVRAESVGRDTTISKIVKMVQDAAASKAPIQKVADTVAGVFVPVVIILALITLFVWKCVVKAEWSSCINYAINVLVISCPCSMGLATPVAIMAATGKGASLGVFYKNAEALQNTKDINCALFDKTGTLTTGELRVTDFICIGADENEAKGVSGGIEALSNHPLAECIASFCGDGYAVENFEYVVGKGAKAEYGGRKYKLGSRSFCVGAKHMDETLPYVSAGKTIVCLERDGELVAFFAIADTVKEESRSAVSELKAMGVKTAMITGDNKSVAQKIADEVGIDDFYAEVMPQDKMEYVKKVQAFGGTVAMIGDGINDSPALMQADIGIAMDNGTDVAIDSADVVLVGGSLKKIASAIRLSKRTMHIIKQNLFWAFFYNVIAIPVAAGAFSALGIVFKPYMSAACMCLSSLFVVTNALRLTRYKDPAAKNDKKALGNVKTVKVGGMMCEHCVNKVTRALLAVNGVKDAKVDLKSSTAKIVLSENNPASDSAIASAITGAGYKFKGFKK